MWEITFSNGKQLTFSKIGNGLYKPNLDNEVIPLLLEEWHCDRAYNILVKIHIENDIPDRLFRLLITGALKISMTEGMK